MQHCLEKKIEPFFPYGLGNDAEEPEIRKIEKERKKKKLSHAKRWERQWGET